MLRAMARSDCTNLAFFSTQQQSLFAGFAEAQLCLVGSERIFAVFAKVKAIAAVTNRIAATSHSAPAGRPIGWINCGISAKLNPFAAPSR